jgi:hypothetical protein
MEQIELNMARGSWKISHLGWLTAVWKEADEGAFVTNQQMKKALLKWGISG